MSQQTQMTTAEALKVLSMDNLLTTTEILEALIDRHGLNHVLVGLELVCEEKAEHLRINWGDHKTAAGWDSAARQIIAVAHKVTV
jgi:hypothetical protein